ncbi:hypothetical protein COLO4_23010 [Corchorus olitorius]|uniref:Uncharacterized protein n=1 Tax=Corchorus olitorius TaxID=93759 RepID=A0A1R3IIM6_9ROSI|nr:hypothetical protein COLO4_23010 [Corchorus olitorius]
MPLPLILTGLTFGLAYLGIKGVDVTVDAIWDKLELNNRHHKKLESPNECSNIFQGRWVYDPNFPPLDYTKNCPFVPQQFECLKHGRPDNDYLKYKWIPNSCKLPRFHGINFLKKVRGKSVMIVGDSVLLGIANGLRCDFLVDMVVGDNKERVLKLDSIEKGTAKWDGYDVLVFNTWNQGLQTGKNQLWDVIEEGNVRHKNMDPLVACEKALNTWTKWVNSKVDSKKTQIFFQGISPDHFKSRNWANPNARNCARETRPAPGKRYPGGRHPAEAVLEKVLKQIQKPIQFMNVTAMSQLRKDGHTSIYGANGKHVDCTNWCLPGLPDVWNELLSARLLLGY